jgi:hypothetical protein
MKCNRGEAPPSSRLAQRWKLSSYVANEEDWDNSSSSPGRRARFQQRIQHLLPHITAWTPPVGNVTHWDGDVDGIEWAFEIKERCDDFIFPAVREEQQ